MLINGADFSILQWINGIGIFLPGLTLNAHEPFTGGVKRLWKRDNPFPRRLIMEYYWFVSVEARLEGMLTFFTCQRLPSGMQQAVTGALVFPQMYNSFIFIHSKWKQYYNRFSVYHQSKITFRFNQRQKLNDPSSQDEFYWWGKIEGKKLYRQNTNWK